MIFPTETNTTDQLPNISNHFTDKWLFFLHNIRFTDEFSKHTIDTPLGAGAGCI
jgi:hypothetical protein